MKKDSSKLTSFYLKENNMQTLEEYTIEKNDLEYEVKIVLDEYPDLSWLGEFTDKQPEKYYIDCKDGYFIGFDGILWHTFTSSELPDGEDADDKEVVTMLEKLYPNHEIVELEGIYPDGENWEVDFYAREILADVPSWYERGSYRYFVNCNHLHPDTKEEDISKWGKDELLKWAIEDYKRLYDYDRNGWCMTGIIVSLNGVDASLWGVESDASKDDIQEIVDQLIWEVNKQIPVEIASLREQANHLESILTSLE